MINNRIAITKVLHPLMIILLVIASFVILFDQSNFKLQLLLLILVYVAYLLLFEYKFINIFRKSKHQVKVQKLEQQPQDMSYPSINQSFRYKNKQNLSFLEGLDQRWEKQSSRMLSREMSKDMGQSFLEKSSFDRSYLPLRLSMSRSKKQNSQEVRSKELTDRFKQNRRSERMDESMNRSMTMSSFEVPKEMTDAHREVMRNCNQRYIKTLKQMKLKYEDVTSYHRKLNKIAQRLCQQNYKEQIENITKIIKFFEEKYLIVIESSQLPQLNQNKRQIQYEEYTKKISLPQVLKHLFNNERLKFPWELKNAKRMQNLFSVSSFPTQKKTSLSEFERKELKKLIIDRFKLDQFLDPTHSNMPPQERIRNLVRLRQFIDGDESQQFKYLDNLSIPEETSRQKRVGMNVLITKINALIPQQLKETSLVHEVNRSWFGYLRTYLHNIGQSEFNYFKIVLSVGVDYGHPHYDLKYTSLERKQQFYHCEFGLNNYLSVVLMFMWLLREKLGDILQRNLPLHKLVLEVMNY